jgi:hypothetical protein
MLLKQLSEMLELAFDLGFHHRRIESEAKIFDAPACDWNDPRLQCIEFIAGGRADQCSLFLLDRMLRAYAAIGNQELRFGF